MAQANICLDPVPFAIRAAMGDGVGHPLQDDRGNGGAVEVNEAGYAAHALLATDEHG